MKNLSIVIKANAKETHNYINNLVPLLDDFNTELIIVNDEIEKLDTQYEYSLYSYSESYKNFSQFCLSLCKNTRILIIEEKMSFSEELALRVKNVLSDKHDCNIKCSVKTYLNSDLSLSYLHEETLVYDKESKVHETMGFIIDDYSFLDAGLNSISKNIYKLVSQERFREVYLWYKNFVLSNKREYILDFYRYLESEKLNLNNKDVDIINNLFINNEIERNYANYLRIKDLYAQKCEGYKDEILCILKKANYTSEELYFSYFLYDLFIGKEYVIDLLKPIGLDLQREFIKYLISADSKFYLDVSNYMMSLDLGAEISKPENIDILIYVNIIKTYIESMSDNSESVDKKQILIQMFIDYTNYGFYLLNEISRKSKSKTLDKESMFLIEVDKSIDKINKGDIESAIRILKKASRLYAPMSRVIEYYSQKLIFDNKKFPYKLSICMIAKDEERLIGRCLASMKPLLDSGIAELVFVDTGSSDRTIDIAEKYTDKIYIHPWQGSFSEARNYNISLAQGEYLFIPDADEELEKGAAEKLIELFSSEEYRNYNTYTFSEKNFADEELRRYSVFTRTFIFKNESSFYYTGTVHNQPTYKAPVKHLDIMILHYGYIMTDEVKDKKFNRTATLLKKELEKNPKSIYYRFQLSVSYSMHNDMKEALEQVQIYMRLLKESNNRENQNLMYYNNAALVHINNKLYDEAIRICNDGLEMQPDFIDFIYYKAYALFEKGEFDESLPYIKEYLDLVDEFNQHDIMHDDRYLFYSLDSKKDALKMLSVSYFKSGKYQECMNSTELFEDDSTLKNVLYVVIESCFKLRDYSWLVSLYENRISNSNDAEIRDVFIYFMEDSLLKSSNEEQEECTLVFANSNVEDEYIDIIKFRAGSSIKQDVHRVLHFIEKYSIDEMDSISSEMIINTSLPVLNEYVINADSDPVEIKNLKKIARFILNRSLNLKQYLRLSKEELLSIFDDYINICSYLVNIFREDLLEEKEILFLSNILNAFDELQNGDMIKCITYLRDSVIGYKEMAKTVELFIETLVPGYESNTDYERERAKYQLNEYGKSIKGKIEELINSGDLDNASILIKEYESIIKEDIEVATFKAVIEILNSNFENAESILLDALNLDSHNVDALYNLAYVYENLGHYNEAVRYYRKAKEQCSNEALSESIEDAISGIMEQHGTEVGEDRKKLVFFIRHDINSFVDDIVKELSNDYETRFIRVSDFKQIDEGMQWADICWFEWCDELIGYGSKLEIAKSKKIICRLHRYEAFTNFPMQVEWNNVDKVIFVANHIRDIVVNKVALPLDKCEVIANGIDTARFSLIEKDKGFNIAWVGYINLRKNPMIVLQYFKELLKLDNRYKLYFAGSFQDEALMYYVQDIIRKLNIQDNVYFDGFISNDKMYEWLKDKHFIITGSIAEGHPVGVMEAMSCGLKPVIHYFPGVDSFYPKEYIYSCLDDFMNIFLKSQYNPCEYRSYIEENYSLNRQLCRIKKLMSSLEKSNTNFSNKNTNLKVSYVIPVYNGEKFICKAIDSIVCQEIPPYEILVLDDNSTDNSYKILKEYESQYRNIKVIRNEKNLGEVPSTNRLIMMAKGDFIKILHQDDFLEKDYSEVISQIKDIYRYPFIVNDFTYIQGNRIVDNYLKGVWNNLGLKPNELSREMLQKILIMYGNLLGGPSSVLFNRSKLIEINCFDNIYGADYLVFLKLMNLGKPLILFKQLSSRYEHSDNSTSKYINSFSRIKGLLKILMEFEHLFNDEERRIAYHNLYGKAAFSISNCKDSSEKKLMVDYVLSNYKYLTSDMMKEMISIKSS